VAEGYRAKVAELEAELARRAAWAKGLEEQLANYRSSAWVKLGRKIRMGPAI
jgi:hypothetical protein